MRLTVERETPVSAAICLLGRRWRRSAMIRSVVCAGVGSRNRCGLKDRSSRPTRPSAAKRAIHFFTVLASTPKAVATAFAVCPRSNTRRTISARLAGVVRAFLCRFIRSPESS